MFEHATLNEINEAIASGELTLGAARTILRQRAKNGHGSGRRAQAWLDAHPTSAKAPTLTLVTSARVSAKAEAKNARTAEQKLATERRKLAWEFRASERKAGRTVTYAQACAKFGVERAKAGK